MSKTSYYRDQLKRVKVKGSFPARVKINSAFNGGDAAEGTNWLSLNPQSAGALVKWLTKNYLK